MESNFSVTRSSWAVAKRKAFLSPKVSRSIVSFGERPARMSKMNVRRMTRRQNSSKALSHCSRPCPANPMSAMANVTGPLGRQRIWSAASRIAGNSEERRLSSLSRAPWKRSCSCESAIVLLNSMMRKTHSPRLPKADSAHASIASSPIFPVLNISCRCARLVVRGGCAASHARMPWRHSRRSPL